MGTFSFQGTAKQLYVVNATTNTGVAPSNAGEIGIDPIGNAAEGFGFKYVNGLGEVIATDLIKAKHILSAKLTPFVAKANRKSTVTISKAQAGVYELRIAIRQFGSGSQENQEYKFGYFLASATDTTTTIAAGLAESLQKSLARDPWPYFNVTQAAAVITIEEVDQPWVLGRVQDHQLDYHIRLFQLSDGSDFGVVADTVTQKPGIGNAKQVADQEFFFAGEKGDQYRHMGYPYVIDTAYNTKMTDKYGVIDLVYETPGSGMNNQSQIKGATFYVTMGAAGATKTTINALATAINTAAGSAILTLLPTT